MNFPGYKWRVRRRAREEPSGAIWEVRGRLHFAALLCLFQVLLFNPSSVVFPELRGDGRSLVCRLPLRTLCA